MPKLEYPECNFRMINVSYDNNIDTNTIKDISYNTRSEELEEIEGVKDNESLRLVRLYNKAGKIQKNYHRSETIRDYSLVQFLGRI
nr:11477_t:CDS:2 [Entrophospora candida]